MYANPRNRRRIARQDLVEDAEQFGMGQSIQPSGRRPILPVIEVESAQRIQVQPTSQSVRYCIPAGGALYSTNTLAFGPARRANDSAMPPVRNVRVVERRLKRLILHQHSLLFASAAWVALSACSSTQIRL